MGENYLANPAIFIIDTLIGLYIFAVLLRLILQWSGADFYNPISQMIVKITHPPIRLFRRFLPSIGKFDTATIVLLVGLQLIADALILSLKSMPVSLGVLLPISIYHLVDMVFNVYLFSILGVVILSWINPHSSHPAASILNTITDPVLNLARKIIPDMGGLDLSPIIALVGLQVMKMLILPPLQQLIGLM